MEVKSGVYRFEQVARSLPPRLRGVLLALPEKAKNTALEVRLRVDQPLAITYPGQTWFVDLNAQMHNIPRACFSVTPQEIEEAVLAISSYSVHTHQHEMKNGYITLRGGHRAGVCGQAVLSGGKISALREITSINLRIARDIDGAADRVVSAAFAAGIHGTLIAGPPASGKTTILRDLARQLSDGRAGSYYKVAVVDERGEIGAVHGGLPQNNLGPCCDILSGYPKGEGILMAVRTLSPQVIICDEIGGEDEVTGMLDGLRCGVKLVVSAHAESLEELLSKRQIVRLLREGAFSKIILLGWAGQPGAVAQIISTEDLTYADGRYTLDRPLLHPAGDVCGVRVVSPAAKA
ncbi:MAG: stage III sporulation protein AA [Oscillospiraceae bacterium]|nr:stage III sporulation protein AA [Oscillospiraceae bacterium]